MTPVTYLILFITLFLPFYQGKLLKKFPGRNFIHAIIFRMFASPIIGVDYCANWLSEQLTSFKLAFQDMSEAILFFINGPGETNRPVAQLLGSVFGSLMFLVRIFQASRKIYENPNRNWKMPPIRGIGKCTLGIITIWCSFVYGYYRNSKNKQQ